MIGTRYQPVTTHMQEHLHVHPYVCEHTHEVAVGRMVSSVMLTFRFLDPMCYPTWAWKYE